MSIVRLTLYAETAYNGVLLIPIIKAEFAVKFAAFFSIDKHRISELDAVYLRNHSTLLERASVAIAFNLIEAQELSDEPSIDAIVAKISSVIAHDRLVTVLSGMAIRLVGIHEQPTQVPADAIDKWCRY